MRPKRRLSKRSTSSNSKCPIEVTIAIYRDTTEKEVQDTSCRGSGGVPQLQKSPKTGGYRGLIKTISAFS